MNAKEYIEKYRVENPESDWTDKSIERKFYKLKKQGKFQKVYGVFSDTHFPYNHPNYLRFLQDTFKKHGVTDIICLGDLVDHHAISRHEKEPDAVGDITEFVAAKEEVEKYVEAFPTLTLTYGNHDSIPERQARSIGISTRYLKSFSELWDLPPTWKVVDEIIIDDVLYTHGIGCNGKDGAINKAIQERLSVAIGHQHSFGGCKYIANKRDIIFGLNVGCGVDIDALAFAYGKHSKYRPTLGCGIVYSNTNAIFVPMGLEYFRNRR